MVANQPIYVVTGAGELAQMRPAAPPSEDALQELIARFPEIIGDDDGSLLLIKREQPIADSDLSSGRWSVDHLFVTREAVPVLVEVKRATNTQLRREVVGQMLDYAANAVAYWPIGTVSELFAETCEKQGHDPEVKLSEFLGNEKKPEDFWSQVDANFRAARIKMLFVADVIPSELARIVEFLNEQMATEVLAVELRYYEGEQEARTLVPRVIGATERAKANRTRSASPKASSIDEWIEQRIAPQGPEILRAFECAQRFTEDEGLDLQLTGPQASIGVFVTNQQGQKLSPMSLQAAGTICINFGNAKWLPDNELSRFYERFNSAIGPLSNTNHAGFPSFPVQRLNDDQVELAFHEVARDWIQVFRKH